MLNSMIQEQIMHSSSDNKTIYYNNDSISLETKLAQALTDKAELEVSYMQQIAFLEQGKGKIIQDLKRMLSAREVTIQELQASIKSREMEGTDSKSSGSVLVNVVSPEKQKTRRQINFDESLPDDEKNAEGRIKKLEDELEEEREKSASVIDGLKSELTRVKAELANVLNGSSPTKEASSSGNKYGEKVRLAKANKRVTILENQVKEANEKIESLTVVLEQARKSEAEAKFELEAREVAIQLLADTKDEEIAAKDAMIQDLNISNKVLSKDKKDLLSGNEVQEVSELKIKLQMSAEQIEKLESDVSEKHQSLENAKMIIASLEKSKQASIDDLKSKLAQKVERISELENDLENNKEVAEAKAELEKYKRQRLEEKMATETEMASLRQEALSGLTRLDEREQEIDELRSKLEDGSITNETEKQGISSQLKILSESVNYIQLQVRSNKLQASGELISALERAGSVAKAATEKLRDRTSKSERTAQNSNDEVINLKKRIIELAKVEEQLKKFQIENNYMKVENTFLKTDKEEVEKTLKQQLESANLSKDKMKQQIAAQLKHLENAKEMIKKLEEAKSEIASKKEAEVEEAMKDAMKKLKPQATSNISRHRSNSTESRRSWHSVHEQLSSILPQCISGNRDEGIEVTFDSNEI